MRCIAALAVVCVIGTIGSNEAQARRHGAVAEPGPAYDQHGAHGFVPVVSLPPHDAPRSRVKRKHKPQPKPSAVAAKVQAKPGTLNAYKKQIAETSIGSEVKPATKALGNIGGLQSHFVAKLAAMRANMPSGLGFYVGSGYRSYAEQARLHALKPRMAARPGRSNHEKGLAGDLKFANRESYRWLHLNSRRYGLRFPLAHEGWHIEPAGVTRVAMKRQRYASLRR